MMILSEIILDDMIITIAVVKDKSGENRCINGKGFF